MEDIDSSPTALTPRKRTMTGEDTANTKPLNLRGSQFVIPTPPDTDQSSSTGTGDLNVRQASPASSTSLSSVGDIFDHRPQSPTGQISAQVSSASGQPPAKKRKLTSAEKQQQAQEKEAKALKKSEQKARRDEEKRAKDEERRKKAEEREARRRDKELEEERRSQEKLKKERAQMRLGAFFQKPATPAKDDDFANEGKSAFDISKRKSLSLEPFDSTRSGTRRSASPSKAFPEPSADANTPSRATQSDYRKYFLPFQLPTHSSLPLSHAQPSSESAQQAFDDEINDPSLSEKYDLGLVTSYASLERQFSTHWRSRRGRPIPNVRQLVDQIQGTSQRPIDLTNDQLPEDPVDSLRELSMRHLQFAEDVRPPYFGTYTKISSPKRSAKLCRNPFSRIRTDTNYDYDSEAEWEEPEEGEDILDDDEDDTESQDDANEMDGFLDDEEDGLKNKRKMITGDLVPAITGLCWENESNRLARTSCEGSPSKTMRGMRMGILLTGFSGKSINPFSEEYWRSEPHPVPTTTAIEAAGTSTARMMPPPRQPLRQKNSNSNITNSLEHELVGAAEGEKGPITSVAATEGAKRSRKPAPKTLSKEDLEEFKEAVIGSTLSKADLLKGLKARFPKLTNELIKATLSENFAQVGASKADKKWLLVVH